MEITPDLIVQVSHLYKALSDPTRLRILTLLEAHEELNVGKIVDKIGLEQSAVSHQLKILRDNHLVKTRKVGKVVYYSLDDAHVVDILSETFEHIYHQKKL
ncbi:ArsR/SmtB family transcription factor [Vagococcus humatus]|uniref:Transcriptional regulator n=1 Tax=Vagococcus humatus TaxID=1889241 RepID=A0A3R9YLG5_9ENTE|nr:metalloregulator ArsR/SmtB family transcription factor [Vagococcus humatus]RST90426.1 transcriptional regulator [Vagococcus humatus]